ncbi:hypothetical protein [Collinsella intestinalis]|uniref:hypothetical protein n=1 Tax=Collinsella intestinalis TaxID=147207 RepID=UPI001958A4B0|nr:hypothetical protein [Collinsella intestinalis]MBM6943074.1 hypothetical protein [Collinsella intestinalis]
MMELSDASASPTAGEGAEHRPEASPRPQAPARPAASAHAAGAPPRDPYLRAENEDDDGYDPYSDRRPEPEPLFERDPWG